MDKYTSPEGDGDALGRATSHDHLNTDMADYRPLVRFLTDTIDDCLQTETELRQSKIDQLGTRNAAFLENRAVLDKSMIALENAVRLILRSIEGVDVCENNPVLSTERTRFEDKTTALKMIFTPDEVGQELLDRFKKQFGDPN